MRSLLLLGLLLTIAISAIQATQDDDDIDYKNPVRSAAQDEIKNLPGLGDAINFKQYSGYLDADQGNKSKKFFHYWLVESQSNPESAPLVLWLNGGPGCSSMGGLFTELGPFTVDADGKELKMNEYSWNKVANVLFLESPSSVGFSYSRRKINFHSDSSTARENYAALKSFMSKFPQYKGRPLYLTGESYAGVYLPTLGVLVDDDKDLNLKGIAIGNGYLDSNKLTESVILFSYGHGLFGKSIQEKLSNDCCNGQPLAREYCKMSGSGLSWACKAAISLATSVLDNGINPYNMYGPCESTGSPSSKDINLRAFINLSKNSSKDAYTPFHVFETLEGGLGDEPPCFDDRNLIKYLNDQDVRSAIHIPRKVQDWDTCTPLRYHVQYPQRVGGLTPQMNSLIGSERNLTMLVYNGDVDTVCNFLGDEWFVDDLGRKVISGYQQWHVNKQVAGYVKHYDGITFATVRGSGHMVPGDRPAEALHMIKIFLGSKCKNVML